MICIRRRARILAYASLKYDTLVRQNHERILSPGNYHTLSAFMVNCSKNAVTACWQAVHETAHPAVVIGVAEAGRQPAHRRRVVAAGRWARILLSLKRHVVTQWIVDCQARLSDAKGIALRPCHRWPVTHRLGCK